MKINILRLMLLGSLFLGNRQVQAQCSTCDVTAPSPGGSLSGGQTLCITADVTNGLSGINFNGSGNKICVNTGVIWNEPWGLNANGVSEINIYGTATLSYTNLPNNAAINVYGTLTLSGGTFNSNTINVETGAKLVMNDGQNYNGSMTTVNIKSGAEFETNNTTFGNLITINNSGTATFTATSTVEFQGSTLTNSSGATLTATAPSNFKIGSGSHITNAGNMFFTNLENSDANQFDNTGTIRVTREFNNHGAFKNDGIVSVDCPEGTTGCLFRVGDKSGGQEFITNGCLHINGNVVFDGPGKINGTLEVGSGYDLTINKPVTGLGGTVVVLGGTSTINISGQYTGTDMKFYDANTVGNDFDVNNNLNNPSVYTVLSSAPAEGCIGAMPVSMTSFTGKWVDGIGNQINWSTSWERNNEYFEIQRSDNAKSFEGIGRVTGVGTTSAIQTYSFVDAQPISIITYYRLKQVDTDGTFKLSSIIAVKDGEKFGMELFPNPVGNELNLRLEKDDSINEVSIFNNAGQRLLRRLDGKATLQLTNLSTGIYVIEVKTTSGKVLRQRFIKQ